MGAPRPDSAVSISISDVRFEAPDINGTEAGGYIEVTIP